MNVSNITKSTRVISSVSALGFIFFIQQSYAADQVDTGAPVENSISAAGTTSDFAKYDANGDGKLSIKEVAGDKMLLAKFKQADTNSDGTLSKEEYDNLNKAAMQK
jgi:hypothetical protein